MPSMVGVKFLTHWYEDLDGWLGRQLILLRQLEEGLDTYIERILK